MGLEICQSADAQSVLSGMRDGFGPDLILVVNPANMNRQIPFPRHQEPRFSSEKTMSLERLQHSPSISLARRGLVQSLPETFGVPKEMAGDLASQIMELSRGYDLDASRISEALHDQQVAMAQSLRNMGFGEAASMTEQHLGIGPAPSTERPH